MGWKITHDACPVEGCPRLGKQYGDYAGGKLYFRVLDDDRNPMYTALCDADTSAERFLFWAERDGGATILQERTEVAGRRIWKDVIS